MAESGGGDAEFEGEDRDDEGMFESSCRYVIKEFDLMLMLFAYRQGKILAGANNDCRNVRLVVATA